MKHIGQTRIEWALLTVIALVCAVLSFLQYRWTGEISRAEPALLRAGLKYEITLYWSSEDDTFIAEVPELAGCSADGATRQEALASVEVVIAEWLETAHLLGRSIPESIGRPLFA